MKSKKGMEAINVVVVMVLALILLSVGIYIIYSKILKPSEATGSVLTCSARGGNVISDCSQCVGGICIKLPTETNKDLQPCCIKELK